MNKALIDRSVAFPWVWLNGKLVRSAKASVSVFDKGFQIGDGVFDTFRVLDKCPLEWAAHWRRFSRTARLFRIAVPFSQSECRESLTALLDKNRAQNAIARIHLSRGIGPRGYSPKQTTNPTLLISLHRSPSIDPGQPNQWNRPHEAIL